MTKDDEMFTEKSKMTFFFFNISRDGIITKKDRAACEASFKALFKPEGKQVEAMMEHLGNLWKITMFLFETPDCTKTFNVDEFVQSRLKWYMQNKTETIELLRKSMEHLFMAADLQRTNYFTIEDFRKIHKAFDINDEELVRNIFYMAGPDSSGKCALDDAVHFYTEFTAGNDEAKHEVIKEAFSKAGFDSLNF